LLAFDQLRDLIGAPSAHAQGFCEVVAGSDGDHREAATSLLCDEHTCDAAAGSVTTHDNDRVEADLQGSERDTLLVTRTPGFKYCGDADPIECLSDSGQHARRFTTSGRRIHENAPVHSEQSYEKQKRLGNPGVFLPH
jgi:hypothetical protein